MIFYQNNKRDQSQSFSNDEFKVRLSELLIGCVVDLDKSIKDFMDDEANNELDILPIYISDEKHEGKLIDCYLTIPLASYILYKLFKEAEDEVLRDSIDIRITELNDAIGPRTGETVINIY